MEKDELKEQVIDTIAHIFVPSRKHIELSDNLQDIGIKAANWNRLAYQLSSLVPQSTVTVIELKKCETVEDCVDLLWCKMRWM